MTARFTIQGRLRSFGYAFRGVGIMLRSQQNAWIHAVATALVIATGLALGLAAAEWIAITLAIVTVWTAEALNTALEFLADAASPSYHPLVGKAKDVAAGGVLIAALGAAVVGTSVFGPKLLGWIL